MFLLCSGLFASFFKMENVFFQNKKHHIKAVEILSKNTYGIYLVHMSILISFPKIMPNLFTHLNAGKFYITECFVVFSFSFLYVQL